MATRQPKSAAGLVLPDQKKQLAERILQTFQAPNHTYNLTKPQALASVKALQALGFRIDALVVAQTLAATGSSAAQALTVADLEDQLSKATGYNIPDDVPLYFQVHAYGEAQQLGPIFEELTKRPFTSTDFMELWTQLKPPFNTAAGDLQNVPGVGAATNAALTAVLDQAFN